MVTYHDSQVTFFKEANKKAADEKLDMCKNLIGTPVYSTITEKSGKISGVKMIGFNVFVRVEVVE